MQLTTTTDYAIRSILYLAASEGNTSTTEISQQVSIPQGYLHTILRRLRAADMLNVERGIKGGWRLIKDPKTITLYDIIRIMENTTHFHPATFEREEAHLYPYPAVVEIFAGMQDHMDKYLKSVSIADLLKQDKHKSS